MKILNDYFLSNIGPRKKNDDSVTCFETESGIKVLAVADGVGGYYGGDIASKIAINSLIEEFNQDILEKDIEKTFLDLSFNINSKIRKYASDNDLENMSTTLILAVISNNKCYFCNIGDSRGYIISNNEISFQTKDHSLMQELLDNNIITKDDVMTHPHKNILTKGLGLKDSVEPDIYVKTMKEGDTILLSSDGLHDYVTESRIIDIVYNGGSEKEICLNLISEALISTNDNVSVAVFKLVSF